jgi:hypothetical protein
MGLRPPPLNSTALISVLNSQHTGTRRRRQPRRVCHPQIRHGSRQFRHSQREPAGALPEGAAAGGVRPRHPGRDRGSAPRGKPVSGAACAAYTLACTRRRGDCDGVGVRGRQDFLSVRRHAQQPAASGVLQLGGCVSEEHAAGLVGALGKSFGAFAPRLDCCVAFPQILYRSPSTNSMDALPSDRSRSFMTGRCRPRLSESLRCCPR